MAKETGLGITTLSVDDAAGTGRDIRTDVNNFQLSTPRGVQDVTGVDKFAYERLLLLADCSMTLNGAGFDDGANLAHSVFKTVPSSSALRTVSLNISGQTLNNEMLFTDYSITRGADGGITWTAPGVLGDGTVPTWS